ncbi:MAG: YncE family protein, partial [Gemmatimonadales bacterium]
DTVSSAVNPYPGDVNPPPNSGAAFDPPILPNLPPPPAVGLILKKDGSGAWRDDNNGNWSAAVTWNLLDHDLAIIDAQSLAVSYATGLMNANMALGLRPGGGVTVVGTDGINQVRFEPNVSGIFVRVLGATVTGPGAGSAVTDLNPHLDYAVATVGQGLRDQSVGDPRGIAWEADGSRGYITGMGSNNVVAVNGSLGRVGLVEVGQGPTGVRYDAANDRVYVLDKFEGAVSVIDAGGLAETARVSFYDPTPAQISDGRPFLYDTHRTSGLGQAACASCHIDGRMDQLAWDLGNPQGAVKPFNQVCNFGFGGCENWHPMKGPMTTQTLIGIIGTEPLHWR